jgi:hypothetical protein
MTSDLIRCGFSDNVRKKILENILNFGDDCIDDVFLTLDKKFSKDSISNYFNYFLIHLQFFSEENDNYFFFFGKNCIEIMRNLIAIKHLNELQRSQSITEFLDYFLDELTLSNDQKHQKLLLEIIQRVLKYGGNIER